MTEAFEDVEVNMPLTNSVFLNIINAFGWLKAITAYSVSAPEMTMNIFSSSLRCKRLMCNIY